SMLENGIDRFLLGLSDECAGIDHHDLRLARVLHDFVPLLEERTEHDLAVHPVLRAAEREEVQSRIRGQRGFLHEQSFCKRGCFSSLPLCSTLPYFTPRRLTPRLASFCTSTSRAASRRCSVELRIWMPCSLSFFSRCVSVPLKS